MSTCRCPKGIPLRICLILVLFGLLAACTNTPTAAPPPPPPGALSITSSTPADNSSGIAVDTNLIVTFSRPMNTASVSVTASPTVDLGMGRWSDGDTTLTLKPSASLAPGTAYTLALEGKDTTGAALAGAKTIAFTTAPAADPPPATPINPNAKPGDASVTVSWDANTEADLKNYTVFWGTSSGALTSSINVDKTQTSKTITGLTNGTTYFFAISATDTAGNASAKTSSISATPVKPSSGDTTPPAVPTDLDASNSNGDLILSWKSNTEPDLKGYNIYLGTTPTALILAGFADKALKNKKFTGLSIGTTYYFAVDAEDTSGNKSAKSALVNATPKDNVVPTLVLSAPTDGAKDVPVNTDLVFKFSEPMRTDSLEFNQLCATSGPCLIFNLPVWSDGDKTATLKPTKLLDGNRDYTLTLGAKDKAGNALNPTPIRFTTIGPKLVSSAPANGATNVNVSLASIAFNFNEPMQQNSLQLNCTFVVNNASTQCGAEGSGFFDAPTWSNSDKTATFTRKGGAFLPSIPYRAEIIGAKDKVGGALVPTAISFTTGLAPDTTPPAVIDFSPAPSARNQKLDTSIAIQFSERMNQDSLIKNFSGTVVNLVTGNTRPLVISSLGDARTPQGFGYVFQPSAPLDYNDTVAWRLDSGATDAAGNHLTNPIAGSFSTIRQVTLNANGNTGNVSRFCLGFCTNTGSGGTNPMRVGTDDDGGKTIWRAYMSFDDLSAALPSPIAAITSAVLTLKVIGTAGNPFDPNNLGTMALERVDYGPTIDGVDFDIKPLNCDGGVCSLDFSSLNEANGAIDVLKFVQADYAERGAHGDSAQFRLRFANTDSHNGTKFAVIDYDVHPTLTITYLVP